MTTEQQAHTPSHDSITHAYLLEHIDANVRELRGWFVKLFFAVLAIGDTIIVALIAALITLFISLVER